MSGQEDYSGRISEARLRQQSRYARPRRFLSWTWLIIGLIIGISGGLYFAWEVEQLEEFDTVPRQLQIEDRQRYAVAILLEYNQTNDLDTAIQRLVELNLPGDDPIQAVAEIACDLVSTGYASNNSGLRAVRVMMTFYQNLERSGCADDLLPIDSTPIPDRVVGVAATSTLPPPASKTPTPVGTIIPTPTPQSVALPTTVNNRQFNYFVQSTFCDEELSNLIEVRVVESDGITPVPGQPIRVRWDAGESLFFTGLKPERGADYADFEMDVDTQYVIEMPGLSDPSPIPLSAESCIDPDTGGSALRSYRVVFVAN